ncbi:hypothetical protein LX36DRAFT_432885 [Colletotrichum falcatum]|nr:hypothetical protein LX36DRAFT_432885 [Colletotrichum falcatum]
MYLRLLSGRDGKWKRVLGKTIVIVPSFLWQLIKACPVKQTQNRFCHCNIFLPSSLMYRQSLLHCNLGNAVSSFSICFSRPSTPILPTPASRYQSSTSSKF